MEVSRFTNKIKTVFLGSIIALLIVGLTGCGGSGSKSSIFTSSSSQVLLGPVIDADVNLYKVFDNSLIYNTITIDNRDLSKAGTFEIPSNLIESEEYYLLEIRGGSDIDANDDGIRDEVSTVVNGTIHSVILGSDLLSGNTKVNPLSEIVYQKLKPTLFSENKVNNSLIQLKLKNISKLLIKNDINGDGKISEKDINQFSPKDHKNKIFLTENKLIEVISLIHAGNDDNLSKISNEFDFSLIEFITNDNQYNSTIHIENNYLFLGNYNGLKIYNIADILNPLEVYSIDEEVSNLLVHGDYLFTGYSNKIKIFDISNKMNVTLYRTIDLFDKLFRDVKIKDNHLFLLTSNASDVTKDGLTVFDITDIDNFVELGFYQGGIYHQLILRDNKAITIYKNTGGFDILDVSNPYNISLIKEVREVNDHSSSGGVLHDNNLYLGFYNYGMRIYDLSDISSPTKVGEINLGYNFDKISIKNDYAYVSNDSTASLKIVDITDKTNPTLVDTLSIQERTYNSIIKDDLLYLSNQDGFQVININYNWDENKDFINKYTYPSISIDNSESTFNTSFGGDILIDNGTAYISGTGIISLSLDSPLSPKINEQKYSYGTKLRITKNANYLFTVGYQNYLEILNILNPENMEFILESSYQKYGNHKMSYDIDIKDNLAYVLSGNDVSIIDVSLPTEEINILNSFSHELFENGSLKAHGDYLYIASDSPSKLSIYDISNYLEPSLVTSIDIGKMNNWWTSSMDIMNDKLFLTTGLGLEIYDISNRLTPFKIFEFKDSLAKYFKIHNNYVYLSSSKGISIIDLNETPKYIGYYNTPNEIGGLDVWGEYLYVPTSTELLIYPLINNK